MILRDDPFTIPDPISVSWDPDTEKLDSALFDLEASPMKTSKSTNASIFAKERNYLKRKWDI